MTQAGSDSPKPPEPAQSAQSAEPAEIAEEAGPSRFWADLFLERLRSELSAEDGDALESVSTEGVLSISVELGSVEADVQGASFDAHEVTFTVTPFSDAQWEQLLRSLASQAFYSAKLLSGELPPAVGSLLEDQGVSLLPSDPSELQMHCDCEASEREQATKCAHVLAGLKALADCLDEDPFLLFQLRGRRREHILQSLARLRANKNDATHPDGAPVTPLEELVDDFWKAGPDLERLQFRVGPPRVSVALLKRLGMPGFWQPHPEIRGSLERLYTKVTERAMALAYQGKGMDTLEDEPETDDDE